MELIELVSDLKERIENVEFKKSEIECELVGLKYLETLLEVPSFSEEQKRALLAAVKIY